MSTSSQRIRLALQRRRAWSILLLASIAVCQGCVTRELWRVRSGFESNWPRSIRPGFVPLANSEGAIEAIAIPVIPELELAFPKALYGARALRVEPLEFPETFDAICTPRDGYVLLGLRLVENKAISIGVLDYSVPYNHPDFDRLEQLPGMQHRHSLLAFFANLRVTCKLTMQEAPLASARPEHQLSVFPGHHVTHEESVLGRIAWTPLALLVDTICLPIQLVTIQRWW